MRFHIRVGTAFKQDPWQTNQELLVSCICKSDKRREKVNCLFTNVADDLSLLSEQFMSFAESNTKPQTNHFAPPSSWFQMHNGVILLSAAWYISFLFFCHRNLLI